MLCTLSLVCSSLCVNQAEFDGNYVDDLDNEISQERQEGEFGLFVFCLCFVSVNRWFGQRKKKKKKKKGARALEATAKSTRLSFYVLFWRLSSAGLEMWLDDASSLVNFFQL